MWLCNVLDRLVRQWPRVTSPYTLVMHAFIMFTVKDTPEDNELWWRNKEEREEHSEQNIQTFK